MKLSKLDGYLFRELLFPLGVWLAFSFFLLFVMQFLRGTDVLLGSAARVIDVIKLIAFLTPHLLMTALPIAFLLALLLGLGRLSEDRELLALGALGADPWRLARMPLLLAAGCGVGVLALGWSGAPWGLRMVRNSASELIKKNVAHDVKAGVFYEDLSHLTVYAEEVNGKEGHWTNVLIHDDRDGSAPLLVLAHEGRLNPAAGEGVSLSLQQGQIHRAVRSTSDYSIIHFERAELTVGLEDTFFHKGRRFRSAQQELTPGELLESARDAKLTGQSPTPWLLAFHWRLAQALSPLAFALGALPLTLVSRKSGKGWAFLVALSGYVGYYAVWRVFENFAVRGDLAPFLAAQAPNLLFGALGFWGIRHLDTGKLAGFGPKG